MPIQPLEPHRPYRKIAQPLQRSMPVFLDETEPPLVGPPGRHAGKVPTGRMALAEHPAVADAIAPSNRLAPRRVMRQQRGLVQDRCAGTPPAPTFQPEGPIP